MFRILDIAVIIFETIMAFMFFDSFLVCDKREFKILSRVLFAAFLLTGNFIGDNILITTILSIAASLAGVILYKNSVKQKVFYALIFILIGIASEYLVGALFIALEHVRPVELMDANVSRFVGIIASKILALIIIKTVCIIWNKKRFGMYRSYWLALMTAPIVNIAILICIAYFFETLTDISGIVLLLLMICIMYSSVIGFYLFDKLIDTVEIKMKNILLENQVDAQEKQAKRSDAENERMRSIKHDFKNHLEMIDAMLENNNIAEAKKYISELGIEKVKNEDAVMNTGNLALDSIINSKIEQARKSGIETELNIKKLPCDLKLTGVECCMLLGNLFDNAIEGCAGLEAGRRKIFFDILFEQNQLFIGLKNTTDKQPKFKNGLPITDKADAANHGIGLKNITEVVEKYNGIMRASCENGVYETDTVLFDV